MKQKHMFQRIAYSPVLPLALSITSLIISFRAINQPNMRSLQTQVKDLDLTIRTLDQKKSLEAAHEKLDQIRKEVAENNNYELASEELKQLREKMQANYELVSQNQKEVWQSLDTQLGVLQNKIQDKTENVIANIDSLLAEIVRQVQNI
jgi:uncharacterized membrane protein YcjF (UPF0283 family)